MREQSRHQAEAQVAFLEEIPGSQPFEIALDYRAADGESVKSRLNTETDGEGSVDRSCRM